MKSETIQEYNAVISHRRSRKSRNFLRNYELYLFMCPAVLYFLIFHYLPLYGIQIAFKDFIATKGIWNSPWVGFKHFKMFFDSYYAWQLIKNTVLLSLYTIVAGFPLPILLALMLNEVRSKVYKKIVQTTAYAPHFISTVVMVGMVYMAMHPVYGVVNTVIKAFGMDPIDFLNKPEYFKSLYVWSGVWQNTGWESVIYFAVLSNVDPEQHEAATIDGASRLQRIWHINLPVIIPTAVILFVLNAGSIMSISFEKIYLMQTPLNAQASDVISTYIYKVGLQGAKFSLTTAIGLFNSVINFLFLIVVNQIAKRLSSTSLW
ncbi:ABC transporter permease subunit [Paenibacillus sp. HWE-109]|uniref:ABC transporter permease n=1 Tax=Paenibacillus sp. HWE-109 TaxID=1306526 RepID=UPI001EDFF85F|nr:ABC transporter permease subunit [Paenibacillus sp. HWE-109]UKS26873.1 ABC transporter permease subunit [Paenibacillus sp. HWE-109]